MNSSQRCSGAKVVILAATTRLRGVVEVVEEAPGRGRGDEGECPVGAGSRGAAAVEDGRFFSRCWIMGRLAGGNMAGQGSGSARPPRSRPARGLHGACTQSRAG